MDADSHEVFVCEVGLYKGVGGRKGGGAGGGGGLVVRVSDFFV